MERRLDEIFTEDVRSNMSEWLLVYVLVAFVIGFISGLIYALRLYKQMEAASDREWAKRRGMREIKPQYYRQMPVRTDPILRRQSL
jgi:hypothetical protein